MRRLCAPALLALTIASPAAAGNTDDILFGNEASMVAGAVTATIGEGSALWYNPAGVSRVQRDTVDASGTAYTIRLYRVPELLRTQSFGEVERGDVNEVVVIPTALTYVRPINECARFGFGLFVTSQIDYTQRARLTDFEVNTGDDLQWLYAASNEESVYHAVAGVGWSVTPKLRLGAAFHLIYASLGQSYQFAGGVQTDPTTFESSFAYLESALTSITGIGVRAGFGVQWEAAQHVSLGVAFQTGSYLVFTTGRQSSIASLQASDGTTGAGLFNSADEKVTEWGFTLVEPYRLRVGVSFPFDRVALSLDGDIQFMEDASNDEFDASFNARVGVKIKASELATVGFGLFTDRQPIRGEILEPADGGADLYGFTAGVSIMKTRRFHEDEDAPDISFGTTIGVRYAYGRGDFAGAAVADDISDTSTQNLFDINLTKLTIHEISVYLGGSIQY